MLKASFTQLAVLLIFFYVFHNVTIRGNVPKLRSKVSTKLKMWALLKNAQVREMQD